MTTPEPTIAPAPSIDPADTGQLTSDRRRWLLAGIIAILGGYLVVLSVGGSLIQQLAGFRLGGVELTILLLSQLIFAVAVTVLGYFIAPAPLGRRVLAGVIFVAAVALVVVLLTLRIQGALGSFGGVGLAISVANPYFMVLLFGGLSWFIVSGVRPVVYAALLLAFAVMPLGFLFSINGVAGPLSALAQLLSVLVVAIVFLLVSRPRTGSDVAPEEIDPVDIAEPEVAPVEPAAPAKAVRAPRTPRPPKAPADGES